MVIFSSEPPFHIPAHATPDALWFSEQQCVIKCLHLIKSHVVYHHLFFPVPNIPVCQQQQKCLIISLMLRFSPNKHIFHNTHMTALVKQLPEYNTQLITLKIQLTYLPFKSRDTTKEKPTGTPTKDTLLRH